MELQQNSKALIFRQIAIDIKTAICNLTKKPFEGIFLKIGLFKFVHGRPVVVSSLDRNKLCNHVPLFIVPQFRNIYPMFHPRLGP